MNEQIIEGLKMGLAKGYSMEQTAASFKNAGYSAEEVDEAVQSLQQARV